LRARLERTAVLSAIAVLTLNLWTGGPMLALWIGSRLQGSGPTTTTAVALVVAVLAAMFFFYSGSPIDQRSGRG
jgi:hypothetical protein